MKSICFGLILWTQSLFVHAGENDSPAFWLVQTIDACTQLPTMRTASAIQVELELFQQEQANTELQISTSNSDVEGLTKWKNMIISKARYLSLMEALSMGRIADYEDHLEWLVSYVESGQRVEELLPLTQVYYLATLYGVSRPPKDSVASEIAEYCSSLSEESHTTAITTRLLKAVEYLIGQKSSALDLRHTEAVRFGWSVHHPLSLPARKLGRWQIAQGEEQTSTQGCESEFNDREYNHQPSGRLILVSVLQLLLGSRR